MSLLYVASYEGAAGRRLGSRGVCVTMVSGYNAAFDKAAESTGFGFRLSGSIVLHLNSTIHHFQLFMTLKADPVLSRLERA